MHILALYNIMAEEEILKKSRVNSFTDTLKNIE